MAERQILRDAIRVGGVHRGCARRWRRRLGFLVWARWRLPAWWNRTLPVPVILNRLDTDFFVLMPLGRRINLNFSIAKEPKLYVATGVEASAIFELIKSQHAMAGQTCRLAQTCWWQDAPNREDGHRSQRRNSGHSINLGSINRAVESLAELARVGIHEGKRSGIGLYRNPINQVGGGLNYIIIPGHTRNNQSILAFGMGG